MINKLIYRLKMAWQMLKGNEAWVELNQPESYAANLTLHGCRMVVTKGCARDCYQEQLVKHTWKMKK